VVFIVGCDDGLLPLRSWRRVSGRRAEVDYAEERRLLFVGMTRATSRLTLLTAARRTLRGEVTECTPSPFLSSVDPALLERRGGDGPGRARRKPRTQQPALF
jgi:superfamily I DNA/RNA helicase